MKYSFFYNGSTQRLSKDYYIDTSRETITNELLITATGTAYCDLIF